uniref:Putative mab-21-like cell fate specification n=1 Tax=Nyssomyia neivai TaxID=330878 RepID=A0A1L8DMD7_9DIPT
MGKSSSKEQIPSNPFDRQIYKQNRLRKRLRDEEKQKVKAEKKRRKELKKSEKKKKKKNKEHKDKLKDLQIPRPPALLPGKKIQSNGDIQEKDYTKEMQQQLNNHSETFILNQILFSIQFLGNFERELTDAKESINQLEYNKTSDLCQHSKTVLIPNVLCDAVDQRIIYVPRHGPQKKIYSRLNTRTLYIEHDNIEITNPGVTSPYSHITNTPIYKMELDESKGNEVKQPVRHAGFVRIKCSEPIEKAISIAKTTTIKPELISPRKSLSSTGSESEEMEISDISVDGSLMIRRDTYQMMNRKIPRDSFMCLPTPKTPNGSTTPSASTSPPSSEYDYTYITALHTHRPLCTVRSSNSSDIPISTVSLPDACITNIAVALKHTQDAPRYMDDKRSSASTEIEEEDPYEMRQYLNSKAFMGYFIHTFQEQLATNLMITHDQLSKATWKGAVIYSEMDEYEWEIIPAITCPWPAEALEWRNRVRAIQENPINCHRRIWPTEEMINKVISMDCHVIPIGYMPKVGQNPQRELEWKVVFPNAERYLENLLSNTQTKIYMMTKILIKCYVEPYIDKNLNMFTAEHLRTHLFWQCENTTMWSEYTLGEILMDFLKSLLNRIKTQRLPDYFIPRRNLLENIPQKILVELHKRIFRITENPVMYILRAMRNVRFAKNFYPRFNYKNLYKCLIVDDPIVILMKSESPQEIRSNPKKFEFHQQLIEAAKKPTAADGDSDADNSDDNNTVGYGAMEEYYKKLNNDPEKRRRTKQVKFEQKRTLDNIERNKRRPSTETIDIDFIIQRNMLNIRRNVVMKLFINHYIQMAKTSSDFKTFNLGKIYLKHAEHLTKLFHLEGYEWDGEEYTRKIESVLQHLEQASIKASTQEDHNVPALPCRENTFNANKRNHIRKPIYPDLTEENLEEYRYKNITSSPISPAVMDVRYDNEMGDEKFSFPPTQKTKENGHNTEEEIVVTVADVHKPRDIEQNKSLPNGKLTIVPKRRDTNSYNEINTLSEESLTDDLPTNNTNLAAILGNL